MPKLNCHISQSLHDTLEQHSRKTGESISHIVSNALSCSLGVPLHTLFQISTTAALVQGVYKSAVSSKFLLNYGDFGLGTFEHLDGEMVVLDGEIYQARSDGIVQKISDDVGTPYAVVLHFIAEQDDAIDAISSFKELTKICDQYRDSDNLFYAFRIDGVFSHIHTRAVKAAAEGLPLSQAAAIQPEFDCKDVDGTLVGIYAPSFSGAFSVPGYHFHFLSNDRKRGGHLLDCSGKQLRIRVERMNDFHLSLPESEEYLRADLSRDISKDLAYAEQMHQPKNSEEHSQ